MNIEVMADYKKWTSEEIDFLRNNCRTMTRSELAEKLGRTESSVTYMGGRQGLHFRMWTPEEDEYLSENWGSVTVPGICNRLQRSRKAVLVRVQKLGLPPYLESGEYISLNQLIIALTGSTTNYNYKMTSWVKNRDFPVHSKRRDKCAVRVVYLSEFWIWAEKNRSFIDFSKMEPLALGMEPDWVAEQRKKDYQSFCLQRKDVWTPTEDQRLVHLLKQHKYGYAELSEMLRRSAGAIQRRCTDLGVKERPVKASNERGWAEADFQVLAEGIRGGNSYTAIGQALGKSEKAVRGKVYTVYMTENADNVRAMMGDGPWGTGAPVPTVKQALFLSGHRPNVREDLSKLAGLLAYRRNELGYEPFWQRHMCAKWHDVRGCTAGETNCDECTEFERIRPQFCVRCGATFFEREEGRVCKRCRSARRKQYLRKALLLNER